MSTTWCKPVLRAGRLHSESSKGCKAAPGEKHFINFNLTGWNLTPRSALPGELHESAEHHLFCYNWEDTKSFLKLIKMLTTMWDKPLVQCSYILCLQVSWKLISVSPIFQQAPVDQLLLICTPWTDASGYCAVNRINSLLCASAHSDTNVFVWACLIWIILELDMDSVSITLKS